MQSTAKSTEDVLDAWSSPATQTHMISSHIQVLPRPVYGAETATSFTSMEAFIPRPQAKTKVRRAQDAKPMSYSSAVSGTQQRPTSITPSVSAPMPSTSTTRTLQWFEQHYAGIPIVDSISPDAWSLLPDEWVTAAASATPSYVHRTALATLTPSASSASSSSSPTNTIDTLPRSPSLSPYHALPFNPAMILPHHAHDSVYAPRALRARSASTASTSTLPEITSDGSPRLSLVGKPPPELTQAYQFNFSFNPGAKAFIPAFPPLVSTSTSASSSTPTTRPAVLNSSSTTTLSSTASAAGSSTATHSACTSTTSLSGGSAPTSPSLPHKLSTTTRTAPINCPYPTAAAITAARDEGGVAPNIEIIPDQKIVPPPPPPTPPLDILHYDPLSRACPVAQYPPSTPYFRPWAPAFERAIEYCYGRGYPSASASGKGKGRAFFSSSYFSDDDDDDVYVAEDVGEGRGKERWVEREMEMERCAEAVVCMRDWDGRRMKDLAWCVVYAASDASLRPAHSSGREGSILSSPKLSARSAPSDDNGEVDVDGGEGGGGTREAGGHTHPDVALFTTQLVDAFGRFYGTEMRSEFVGYLREYGRETFVGWWEVDSTNSIFRPLLTAPPLLPMPTLALGEAHQKQPRSEAYETRLRDVYEKQQRSEYNKQQRSEYEKQQRSEYEKQRRRRERRELETQANLQAALALTRWLARLFMLSSGPSTPSAESPAPAPHSSTEEEDLELDGAGFNSAEDGPHDGVGSSGSAGPGLSVSTSPIIDAAQMLECIDVLCAPPPHSRFGAHDLDLDDDVQIQMAMARAAGLFELVGNTEESVLWSGIAEVLDDLHQSHIEDTEGDWLTEEDERYAMERYPLGGGRRRERGEERELGDVMDKVLGALGCGGMSFPMPVPVSMPMPGLELESAW
ncbi:uncharacterized protein STEHIDRAFT_147633 [Stereum hirsutum FP-91666 SS1]|uniref:uncharacterized protein n=1 Tax=Stereum hirsutum (strain FP-91666) TaxID=721885 RepID=UPI000444A6BB|nr:uncharacterized protein STEHIDRAFT_147633 [Stereum hirsutum FP-91666 SS1]EIM86141.1 hypothetical protein STEHIDRAFT_147633 [Stereum hirsutum FP-91666 SS1]